jgi:multidrug efflux pump subunit AcrA (membrane-fusion protein)
MSRRVIIGGVALLLLVTFVVLFILFREDRTRDTVEVTRGDIDVVVETVGRVDVRDLEILTAPLTTRVEVVAVDPGDEVQAGDVLVTLDQSPFQDAIDEAEMALIAAEAMLQAFEDEPTGGDPERIAERIAAQESVREAQRIFDEAESALAESLVLAPFDGTIISVSASEGSTFGQNAELVQIAELQAFELSIDIDEIDLPLIDRGAETRIVLEAYPEHEIISEIHTIARRAEIVAGTTVFPATVRFSSQDGITILPGMNADVQITTEIRENILLLPEAALVTVGRRTFVDVVVNGDVERREIRTGIRGRGMVEIAEGLEEGDHVVLP